MTVECGVAELLREGGPVRAPLRACCVAALVGRESPAERCAAGVHDPPDAMVAREVPAGANP